jgi:hypothetical protein
MKWALRDNDRAFCSIERAAQAPSPPERGFLNRMFHPFASAKNKAPKYQDSHLRGLLLEVQVPDGTDPAFGSAPATGSGDIEEYWQFSGSVDFPTSQRIDIHLLNSAGEVLTRWSENRAFTEKSAISRSTHAKKLFTTKRSPPANCSPVGFTVSKFSSPNIRTACPAEVHDRAIAAGEME